MRIVMILMLTIGLNSAKKLEAKDSDSPSNSPNLGISVRGGYITGILGTGLDSYYLINDKLQIGMMYASSTHSDGSSGGASGIDFQTGEQVDWDFHSKAKMKANVFGFFGRYFLWNSFNVSSGLLHRKVEVSFSHLPFKLDTDQGRQSGNITGSSLSVLAQIGNRWTFDNGFTIGADWIGYTIPIVQLGKSGSTEGINSLNFEGANEFKDTARGVGTKPILQGFILDIGYIF